MTRQLLTILALLILAIPARADRPEGEGGRLRATPVAPGIWRGHAPYWPRQFETLRQMGFRTVVDIRGSQPIASAIERRMVERHGLVYRKVPISFHPLRDGSGERVLAALQNAADYPMYVHCNVDHDRTSVAVATYRVRVQGWSGEAAEAEAKQFGLRRLFIGLNRYLQSVVR